MMKIINNSIKVYTSAEKSNQVRYNMIKKIDWCQDEK